MKDLDNLEVRMVYEGWRVEDFAAAIAACPERREWPMARWAAWLCTWDAIGIAVLVAEAKRALAVEVREATDDLERQRWLSLAFEAHERFCEAWGEDNFERLWHFGQTGRWP